MGAGDTWGEQGTQETREEWDAGGTRGGTVGDKKQQNANNVNNFQAKLEIQNVTISSTSCGLFIDLFSKLINKALAILYTIKP